MRDSEIWFWNVLNPTICEIRIQNPFRNIRLHIFCDFARQGFSCNFFFFFQNSKSAKLLGTTGGTIRTIVVATRDAQINKLKKFLLPIQKYTPGIDLSQFAEKRNKGQEGSNLWLSGKFPKSVLLRADMFI